MNTKNANTSAIGGRIKKLRIERGYTQAGLGELLNVCDSVISKLETNKNQPTFLQLLALCDELDTSSDYLIFGASRNSAMSATLEAAILECADEIRACRTGKKLARP